MSKSVTKTIQPSLSKWDFAARERKLFRSAVDIPTWRAANQSRRLLAAVTVQLSDELPLPGVATVPELETRSASALACLQLAAVAVRSAGAIISLVACGYEREALTPARTLLEAVLRGRQINDDPSGAAARAVLQSRTHGSLKSVAHRYGHKGDVEFLDRFAHADVLTLLPLGTRRRGPGPATEIDFELRPQRGVLKPANQLYQVAYDTTSFCGVLAEAFDVTVAIPPWLSGQLMHYKDNPLPDVL